MNSIQICPPHLSNGEPLYLGKSKNSLFNITIHILRIIYLTSEENNCCTGRFFSDTVYWCCSNCDFCMTYDRLTTRQRHVPHSHDLFIINSQYDDWVGDSQFQREQPEESCGMQSAVWPLHGLVNPCGRTEVYCIHSNSEAAVCPKFL